MAFPYTYSKTLTFTLKGKYRNIKTSFLQSIIFEKLRINNKLKGVTVKGKKVLIKAIAPVINFQYSVEFKFFKDEDEIQITYDVNLDKLLMIVLVTIILTAFFSFLSVKYFLILAGILTVSLYAIFYLIIDNFIQKIVKNGIDYIIVNEDYSEKYSDEQLEWIYDDGRCSACGKVLSEFDLHCPDCGLKLKRSRYTIPLDVSKYKDKQVSYHFKKKQ